MRASKVDEEIRKENAQLFSAWMAEMDWNKHGGIKLCAEALGKTATQISRYNNGAPLSKELRLAMTALVENLRPWDEKTGGTPPIHISFSIG